jgi:predicted transcriptional regulator
MKDSLVAIRMDTKTLKLLKEAAEKDDRSVSWIIRKAIETFLQSERTKQK